MSQANQARLGPWVVKQGVSLGGLAPEDRALLFALVWAAMPAGPFTERQVNEALRSQLDGAAACLNTDHVELRRWLVDAGWLQRDGFGREYRRATLDNIVNEAARDAARELQSIDIGAWVAQLRAKHDAHREARRHAWRGGQDRQPQATGGAA